MSSMYRAAQKLYTSATAPSKKQKAKQEGWRVENLAASTGHQVAALDEVLNQKLSMLNERVDSLASQQERLAAQQSDGLTKLGALLSQLEGRAATALPSEEDLSA